MTGESVFDTITNDDLILNTTLCLVDTSNDGASTLRCFIPLLLPPSHFALNSKSSAPVLSPPSSLFFSSFPPSNAEQRRLRRDYCQPCINITNARRAYPLHSLRRAGAPRGPAHQAAGCAGDGRHQPPRQGPWQARPGPRARGIRQGHPNARQGLGH
jgi:hypothetical protein